MKATQTTTTEILPGDILVAKWGYSMILNTFYQVVSRTPKTATILEIGSTMAEGWSNGRGNVLPCPAQHERWSRGHKDAGKLKLFTRKVHDAGSGFGEYVGVDESRWARKWDGKPCYEDHWD